MRRSGRLSGRQADPYISWGMALAAVLFVLYVYPGFLSPVTPHFDGTCRTVELGSSVQDLRIDPATGIAYLSYYDRFERRSAGNQNGTVMLVDLTAAEPRARAALTTEPADFKPSGISLLAQANAPKRLFVVNRTSLGKHSIHICGAIPRWLVGFVRYPRSAGSSRLDRSAMAVSGALPPFIRARYICTFSMIRIT